MRASLLSPVRREFRAIAVAIVPEAAELRPEEWLALEGIVEEQLAPRPHRMQRQLVTFVRLIALFARFRWMRPMRAQSAVQVRQVLESLERSPLLLLRRGMWGLRTLVFLGFYARPGVAEALGYRADARGWAARPLAGRGTELVERTA